jgi:hypothetical protein
MRKAIFTAAVLAADPVAAETVSAVGTWTVTGVRNDPSMTITALVDDDPSYMGAKLSVASSGITWMTGATNGEGTYDDCAAPRFAPSGGAIAVVCAGAPWGPPDAVLKPLGHDRLELTWYDGGILALTRD